MTIKYKEGTIKVIKEIAPVKCEAKKVREIAPVKCEAKEEWLKGHSFFGKEPMSLYFYTVDALYTEYLRQFDNKVPMEHPERHVRPYIGIILEVNDCKYFAPMSSPKEKHKKLQGKDIYKIADGEYGVINFNNMIPVPEGAYHLLDFTNENDAYKELLYNQYRDIRQNASKILKLARRLHGMYVHGHIPPGLDRRCCNFSLLENKCRLYTV